MRFTRFFAVLLFALAVWLALPACGGAPSSPVSPSPTPPDVTTGATAVTVELTARGIAFDKKTLSVPAWATVTVILHNQDEGVPHNFALYQTRAADEVIFRGQVITGVRTVEYKFTAPGTPGTYFFRCDPHPASMFGDFIVTAR